MESRQLSLVLAVACGLVAMATHASAAFVGTGESSSAGFSLPASLINGASPSYTGGGAPVSSPPFAGWSQMTDGVAVAASPSVGQTMLLDNVMFPDNAYAVYILDTSLPSNANGYDIRSIQTYAAWGDERCWQGVAVFYALVGETITPYTFLSHSLGSFSYQPGVSGDTATKLTITDDQGGGISGVKAVQIMFVSNGNGNNNTAYQQISVVGTPVPEPASMVMLVSALVGLAACGRRKPQAGANRS